MMVSQCFVGFEKVSCSSSRPQISYIADDNPNLLLPGAAITGMYYHAVFTQCWGKNPELHAC